MHAEDTTAALFAGMNETFLNVAVADAVLDAVRLCWRSSFGARTLYYGVTVLPGRHGHRRGRAATDPFDAGRRDVHRQPLPPVHATKPVIQGRLRAGRGVGGCSHRDVVEKLDAGDPPARATARSWQSTTTPRAVPASARWTSRRASRRRSTTRRSGRSPSWAGGSSITTGFRRTPSGPSTLTEGSGCCRAGLIMTLTQLCGRHRRAKPGRRPPPAKMLRSGSAAPRPWRGARPRQRPCAFAALAR